MFQIRVYVPDSIVHVYNKKSLTTKYAPGDGSCYFIMTRYQFILQCKYTVMNTTNMSNTL